MLTDQVATGVGAAEGLGPGWAVREALLALERELLKGSSSSSSLGGATRRLGLGVWCDGIVILDSSDSWLLASSYTH